MLAFHKNKNKKVMLPNIAEDSKVGPNSRKKETKYSPCSHLVYTRQNLERTENDKAWENNSKL